MPRAGLDRASVISAAADLADEIGLSALTMAGIADRVGVRTPSLYKHVSSQDDLHRGIAALALTEAAEVIGTAVQGRSGREALRAAAVSFRDFVISHPARYAATTGLTPAGPDDPLAVASQIVLSPFRAVLRGYDVDPDDVPHALRAMRSAFHGFATLQAAGGFQWATDVDASFDWLIDLVDAGLRCGRRADEVTARRAVAHRGASG